MFWFIESSVDILTPLLFKICSSTNSYLCLVNLIGVFLRAVLLNFCKPYSFFPFVLSAPSTVCVCNICRELCVICCLIFFKELSNIGLVDRDITEFSTNTSSSRIKLLGWRTPIKLNISLDPVEAKNIVKCTQYFYDVLIIQRNLSVTEHQGNDLFSVAGFFSYRFFKFGSSRL